MVSATFGVSDMMNRIACIIPARFASTRFPGKMLKELAGKPLIVRVWEAAMNVRHFDCVAVATDSEEIAECIRSHGGRALMTDPRCRAGTERLVEVMRSGEVQADIWVNWQGDEPFVHEEMIAELLQSCEDPLSDIWTLRRKIDSPGDMANPHIAKVVCDANGFALLFSRSPIPHARNSVRELGYIPKETQNLGIGQGGSTIFFSCTRDSVRGHGPSAGQKKRGKAGAVQNQVVSFFGYKHVGLYAFTTRALESIAALPPCALEEVEQLEQLRWLFHGLRIRVHETQHEVFGIDLPEHLARASALLHKSLV